MDGLTIQNGQGSDPGTQERKERTHEPLRDRADLQLVRRAQPTAGGQTAVSLQSNRQETTISWIEIPRHRSLNKIAEKPGIAAQRR